MEKAIESKLHVVLVCGIPGSGKSTLISSLLKQAKDFDGIHFDLDLFENYLAAFADDKGFPKDPKELELLIKDFSTKMDLSWLNDVLLFYKNFLAFVKKVDLPSIEKELI